MSNPLISVTFPRGWWHTITDAVRDAGPECALLAADLERAVTEGPCDHRYGFDGGSDEYRCVKCRELAPVELGHADSAKAGPYAVTQAELVAALSTVALKCFDYAAKTPTASASGHAFSITGNALMDLKEALLNPERDGAATPPANSTGASTPSADESATGAANTGAAPSRPPFPTCGALHPWMANAWCTLGRHPDKRHEAQSADQYRTVVGWSE